MKFGLNPEKPPKTDWSRLDAMTDAINARSSRAIRKFATNSRD